jgi:hypothetical protein
LDTVYYSKFGIAPSGPLIIFPTITNRTLLSVLKVFPQQQILSQYKVLEVLERKSPTKV